MASKVPQILDPTYEMKAWHASYRTSHWKALRKTCAPLAFSLGRHRNIIPNSNNNIFQLMDLLLPSKISGGVQVVHSVCQRIPQANNCLEHVFPGQHPWLCIFARFAGTFAQIGLNHKKSGVFVEDAGRHWGRRAHRSRCRWDDTETLFQIEKNIYFN